MPAEAEGSRATLRKQVAHPSIPIHTFDVATLRVAGCDGENPRKGTHEGRRHVFPGHPLRWVEAEAPHAGINKDLLLAWAVSNPIVSRENDPSTPSGGRGFDRRRSQAAAWSRNRASA